MGKGMAQAMDQGGMINTRTKLVRGMNSPEEASGGEEEQQRTRKADMDRPLIHRAEDLLQGRREVWIEHGTEMYRLRLTAAGKLYLSK